MFLIRFIKYILGYVSFSADGGNPEKLLNLAAHRGAQLWNLRRRGTLLYGCVLLRNFKVLEECASNAGVSISVESRHGFFVTASKHRKRYGFLLGTTLFLSILWYFSGYIWVINIEGNKTVDKREILYTLNELGLSPGVRRGSLDAKQISQQALLKMPELSFMHINIDSDTANVEVGERAYEPEIVPANIPCNIRAAETGIILKIVTSNGTAMVKPGDTISKGGLLVSGVVLEPKTSVTRYLHAGATVVAKTKHQLSAYVPYNTKQEQNTGRVMKKYTLSFLGLRVPLYLHEPRGSFRRLQYKKPLEIFGLELPVCEYVGVYTEYTVMPVKHSPAQAANEAMELLKDKEQTELYGMKITKRDYVRTPGDSGMTVSGSYECEEDIAYQEEIRIS